MSAASQKGFTLVEILVVLAIFAILAIVASTGLFAVISANKSMQTNSTRFAQLQLTMLLIERDIEQAINRPIVNEMGEEVDPLVGKEDYLELTHAGVTNPYALSTRSTLQRVAYLKVQTQLIRQTWPVLDRVSTTVPTKRVLIDIDSLQIHFLDNNLKVYRTWPPGNPISNVLPRAIEIKLILPKWGEITRLFYLHAQPPIQEYNADAPSLTDLPTDTNVNN